jgi:hypothetical protein
MSFDKRTRCTDRCGDTSLHFDGRCLGNDPRRARGDRRLPSPASCCCCCLGLRRNCLVIEQKRVSASRKKQRAALLLSLDVRQGRGRPGGARRGTRAEPQVLRLRRHGGARREGREAHGQPRSSQRLGERGRLAFCGARQSHFERLLLLPPFEPSGYLEESQQLGVSHWRVLTSVCSREFPGF